MKPSINDITTCFEEPPKFVAISATFPDKDYSYPRDSEEIQTGYYPYILPLTLPQPPDVVFPTVKQAAYRQKNWRIILADKDSLRIEAVATTKLLRFRDDVVIELRADVSGGTVIHMRSKSRLGKGDLGANARRISDFLGSLRRHQGI